MGSWSQIVRCVYSLMVFFCVVVSNPIAIADAPMSIKNRKVTDLVDQVCKKTSNYKNCTDILYSDPRTPDADRYTLAYISFGLARLYAGQSRLRIAQLLNNPNLTFTDRLNLQICGRDYKKAMKDIGSAFNDLDSETFFTLPGYANNTARAALDCQAHYSSITSETLNSICEVCTVIAKLFTNE